MDSGKENKERRSKRGLLQQCCLSSSSICSNPQPDPNPWRREEELGREFKDESDEEILDTSDEEALINRLRHILERVQVYHGDGINTEQNRVKTNKTFDIKRMTDISNIGKTNSILSFMDAFKDGSSVMQLLTPKEEVQLCVTRQDECIARCTFDGLVSKTIKKKSSTLQTLKYGLMENSKLERRSSYDWKTATRELSWKLELFGVSVNSEIFRAFLSTHILKLGPFFVFLSPSEGEVDIAQEFKSDQLRAFKWNLIFTYSCSDGKFLVEAACSIKSDGRKVLSWTIDASESFDTFFSNSSDWESRLPRHHSLVSMVGLSQKSGVFQVLESDVLKGIHVLDSKRKEEDETFDECLEHYQVRRGVQCVFRTKTKDLRMVAAYFYDEQEIASCEFQFEKNQLQKIGSPFQKNNAFVDLRKNKIRGFSASIKNFSKRGLQNIDILGIMSWRLRISSFGTVRLQLFETIEEKCNLKSTEETIFVGSATLHDTIKQSEQILEFKNKWKDNADYSQTSENKQGKGQLQSEDTSLVASCMCDEGLQAWQETSLKMKVSERSHMKFSVPKGMQAKYFQRQNFEDKVLGLMWKLHVFRVNATSPLFQATLAKKLAGLGARVFHDQSGTIHTATPGAVKSAMDKCKRVISINSVLRKGSRKKVHQANVELEEIFNDHTADLLEAILDGKLCQTIEFYRTADSGLTMNAKAFAKTRKNEEQELISCLFGFNTETNSWKESVLFKMRLSALTSNSKVMTSVKKYLEDSYIVLDCDKDSSVKLVEEVGKNTFHNTLDLERLDECPDRVSVRVSCHYQSATSRRESIFSEYMQKHAKSHSTMIENEACTGAIVSCFFCVPSTLMGKKEDTDAEIGKVLHDEKNFSFLKISNLAADNSLAFQHLDNFLIAFDADLSFKHLKQLWSDLNKDGEIESDIWASYSGLVGVSDVIKLQSAICNEKLFERRVEFMRTDGGIKLKAMYCFRKNRYLEDIPYIEVASCIFENLSGVTKEKLSTHNLLEHLCELRICPKFVSLKKTVGGTSVVEMCVWEFGKNFFQNRQSGLLKILESGEKTEDLIDVLEKMVVHSTHPVHLAVGIACSAKRHSFYIETREHTLLEICKHFSKMALKFINNSPLYEDDMAVLVLVRGGLFHGHIISEASNYELTDFLTSGKIQEALSSVLYGVEEVNRLTTQTRIKKVLQQQSPNSSSQSSLQRSMTHFVSKKGSETSENLSFKTKITLDIKEIIALRPKYTMYRKSPFLFSCIELISHFVVLVLTINYIWSKPTWLEMIQTGESMIQLLTTVIFVVGGLCHEIGQALNLRTRYIAVWNILDNASYAFYIVWVWVLFSAYLHNQTDAAEDVAYRVLSLNGILVMFKILRFLSLSALFGPLVMMIMNMVTEIITFMMIFAMVIWGFAATLHSQFSEMDEFSSMTKSMMTLIEVSMGNIEYEMFDEYTWRIYIWGAMLLTVYLIVGTVILLNLLIAILSNTYDKIQSDSKGQWSVMRAKFILERFVHAKTADNHIPNAFLLLPPPFNLVMIPGQLFVWCLYLGMVCFRNKVKTCFQKRPQEFIPEDASFDYEKTEGLRKESFMMETTKLAEKKKRSEALQDSYAEYYRNMFCFEKEYAELVGNSSMKEEKTIFSMLSSDESEKVENEYWKAIGESNCLLALYCVFWLLPLSSIDLLMLVFVQLPPYVMTHILVLGTTIPTLFGDIIRRAQEQFGAQVYWLAVPFCAFLAMVYFVLTVGLLLLFYPPMAVYLSLMDYFCGPNQNFIKDLINVDDRDFHCVLPYITRVNLGSGFLTKQEKLRAEKKANESKLQIEGQLAELKREFADLKKVVLENMKQDARKEEEIATMVQDEAKEDKRHGFHVSDFNLEFC